MLTRSWIFLKQNETLLTQNKTRNSKLVQILVTKYSQLPTCENALRIKIKTLEKSNKFIQSEKKENQNDDQ